MYVKKDTEGDVRYGNGKPWDRRRNISRGAFDNDRELQYG